jgi:phosphatidylglycerol---prolipoprotein diacylglyceryl transferase
MRRFLFHWRNLTIWSYPAMLYFGLVFGVLAGNIAAHAGGINALRAYIATLILIVPALTGARLLYVATNWKDYRHNRRRIWNRGDGGLIMYGGLPLMLLCSIPLLHAMQLNLGKFWDSACFTICIGMIFARIGCLLNGCCGGHASNSWFSTYLPNSQGVWEKRIPTQALEAICAVALLISAAFIWHRAPFPGALFLFVTLGYSSARFVMEFARERESGSGLFRITHALSVFAFATSFVTLTLCWPH